MKPTILVLGGGIGGIRTARLLANKLGNEEGIEVGKIIVFEKEHMSLYYPSLTWMMVGKREAYQVQQDLTKAEREGLEIVNGTIQNIDPSEKTVRVNDITYQGDYIVVALGTDMQDVDSLSEVGFNFYSVEGAANFYKQLKDFKSGCISIVVSSLPHKSPVAPYEAALLIEDYLQKKGIRGEADISIYTPESKPMDFASDEVSEKIAELLGSKGIRYRPNTNFVRIENESLVFKTNTGETTKIKADLIAYTPTHVCPKVVNESGLTGKSDWIETDNSLMKTQFDGVYAIGDITSFKLSNGSELPKAGIFAEQQAEIVAHNIAREIQGLTPNASFTPSGGYILDSGSNATKVAGDFASNDVDAGKVSSLRHWEKILMEKSWFLKNF